MDLFPAIDLRDGKAVRLLRGDYDQMTVYSDDPLETAKKFEAAGAKFLHVVDLDGAKDGNTPNFDVIKRIVEGTNLKVEVGGGIRNIEIVEKYLQMGVFRVIIGTAALDDPKFTKEAVARFGEQVAIGVDLKDGCVATHGWTQVSDISGLAFCDIMQQIGVKTVIVTDISKDGAMEGVNRALYVELWARCSMEIIASGGVSSIDDLIKLSRCGVSGAIVGKALYEGKIDLEKAFFELYKAERE